MTLAIYTSVSFVTNGGVVPAANAQVEVRSEATGNLTALYSDRDAENSMSNPFNADSEGRFQFYTSGGAYQVKVTDTDSNESTLRHQAIGTMSEYDMPVDPDGPAGSDPIAAIGRGAIVEEGSNSNGFYVRWDSGLQLCWNPEQQIDLDDSSNSEQTTVNFPVSFVPPDTVPVATIHGAPGFWDSNDDRVSIVTTRSASEDTFVVIVYKADGGNFGGTFGSIRWVAWGFWK